MYGHLYLPVQANSKFVDAKLRPIFVKKTVIAGIRLLSCVFSREGPLSPDSPKVQVGVTATNSFRPFLLPVISRAYTVARFLKIYFNGDFSTNTEAISTKLSMRTADGLE